MTDAKAHLIKSPGIKGITVADSTFTRADGASACPKTAKEKLWTALTCC